MENEPFNLEIENPLHFREIFGLFEVVSDVPTGKPSRFYEQFKIYKNGTTRRFYWYDYENDEWVYAAGTV